MARAAVVGKEVRLRVRVLYSIRERRAGSSVPTAKEDVLKEKGRGPVLGKSRIS